uniref:Transcription factor HIVEP3-like n=1 Tax=Cyprinodon variegatus TaxID=28743 RepID=A0A3Q2DEH4_CYPVA
MEAEPNRPANGDRSGRQESQHETSESSLGSCPPQQPQQPPNPRPVHKALGRLQNRQPKRTDLLRLQQQQAAAWQHSDTPGTSGGSFFSATSTSSTTTMPSTQGEHGHGGPSHSSQEVLEGVSSPKKGEKKPQKPGKYVCSYCGRPCAKPSVLEKHIRSHTGERPYPCAPCGFSFKTKSNLYKHRKSHAHRIKVGLASSRDQPSFGGPKDSSIGEDREEHTEGESTESEDETGECKKSSSKEMLGQQRKGGKERPGGSEESQRPEDSQAVRQRLALRLRKRPGSKGSTESGYFSGSGSTDLSQVSPPSSSAKTYAEIILGKYGRIGGQQRSPHQHQLPTSHSSSTGTEEKSVPFAVPKTQVIEHITKLITINEAVVDTSEIDSVKPRRSSLSRKSSMETPKFIAPKDPYAFDPKTEAAGPSSLRHSQNPESDPLSTQELSAVPLLRSHSLPSATSQLEPFPSGTMSPRGYRLSQSFDEQQAVVAEMRGIQRMLRRQPAIEVPLGAESMLEEGSPASPSSSTGGTNSGKQPHQLLKSQSVFECKSCRARFQHSEGYESHIGMCQGPKQEEGGSTSSLCRENRPPLMHSKFRALAMAVRKRRKEESLEEDPPSPGTVPVSGSFASLTSVLSRPEHSQAFSGVTSNTEPNKQQQQQDRKGVSVIQHTSSFEKQESVSMESQEPDLRENQQQKQPEPKPSPSTSRLIRQPNIQVPEILVTLELDADMPSVSPPELEKPEEFQWPPRSQTLAQLPAEKLPPKKKRLRLAEAAQSSGESSFESMSLPRSPSQESNVSSLSASFEDTGRSESVSWAIGSQSSQMLMVPSASQQHHQSHKEMRRSASEQAPPRPQQTEEISETRSKSFDYGSLSSQQSTSSWKEKRKFLVKQATLGEPEQEMLGSISQSPIPGPSHPNIPYLYPHFFLDATEKPTQLIHSEMFSTAHDVQFRDERAFQRGPLSQLLPITTAITEVLSPQVIHRAFLQSQSGGLIQSHPGQIQVPERLRNPLHHLPPLAPLPSSPGVRSSQSLYCPFPPRLGTQIPFQSSTETRSSISSLSSTLTQHSLVTISYHKQQPVIATCLSQLTPVVSLMVPVRLQTHRPTFANAIYTTLSQILASTRSQNSTPCTAMIIMAQTEQEKLQRSYLKVPSQSIKNFPPLSLSKELSSVSVEEYSALGPGGSKRMLSPAASLELSTEAMRHQKRVKEEEEEQFKSLEEEEDVEPKVCQEEEESNNTEKTQGEGEKQHPEGTERTGVKLEEAQKQLPWKNNNEEKEGNEKSNEKKSQKKEEVPTSKVGVEKPSPHAYPSLHTSTSVNWCYLKYVKPNPSAERDPRTSVYSTWSVSAHNPNLPGLSTKLALSLLCSKQKHSSETYTMATASTPATTTPSTLPEVKDEETHEKENRKEKREEEAPSTSKQGEPSWVRIFEGGYRSNDDYVYVRGRGRGKYICGECGIRCKKPSMLKKHIRTHTDVRPYICKHCNFAFKTKGNLTKHMKSKAHGKKCQAVGVSEASLDEPESEETGTSVRMGRHITRSEEHVFGSEEQEEHQFSDVEESDEEEDDDEDDEEEEDEEEEEEESTSHEDPPSSCSSDTNPSTGGHTSGGRRSERGTSDPDPGPPQEPAPRGVWPGRRTASPGRRRALYSRRGWKGSPRAFSPSNESCSPSRSLSPRLELSSPIHSLSPRTDLSSPSRHVSPSPERRPSPVRAHSPLHPISSSCYRPSTIGTPPSPLGLEPPLKLMCVLPLQEKSGAARERPTLSETRLFPSAFRLSTCEAYPGLQATDHIFSHLPMHSQQAKVPCLMIPIGGIQMVQARPRSHPTTPSSPTSPPLEGPSMSRFETYWGGTPRTQGLRTPGDTWSDFQAAGASRHSLSTDPTFSKPKLETTDSKQYGSSHSFVHPQGSTTETTEGSARDTKTSETTLGIAASVACCAAGAPPEREDVVEGDAKGDTEQST